MERQADEDRQMERQTDRRYRQMERQTDEETDRRYRQMERPIGDTGRW
jgi:hypothetical protein